MTGKESIFLGALQGVTEFLPISSSAHLLFVPLFLKINESNINKLAFDIMVHFGTLCSLLLLFGGKFFSIVKTGLRGVKEGKWRENLLLKIILSTAPAAFSGFFFKDFIEKHLRDPKITVLSLILVSLLMLLSEKKEKKKVEVSYLDAIIIGFAQALSLIPGVSRSGITIAVAFYLQIERKKAIDFSFLLAIPIIFGASLFGIGSLYFEKDLKLYLLGLFSSFLFGTLSLKFLLDYLKNHSLALFAYYRIGIALFILFFL